MVFFRVKIWAGYSLGQLGCLAATGVDYDQSERLLCLVGLKRRSADSKTSFKIDRACCKSIYMHQVPT